MIEDQSQQNQKTSIVGGWFKKNKILLICIGILTLAVIIISIILYFKCSSINSLISCKEDIIEGLNKEITKAKLQISKLDIKNEELEKMNKELQKKQISDKNALKKKLNTKIDNEKSVEKNKSDEIDSLVFNGPASKENDEELEELPLN